MKHKPADGISVESALSVFASCLQVVLSLMLDKPEGGFVHASSPVPPAQPRPPATPTGRRGRCRRSRAALLLSHIFLAPSCRRLVATYRLLYLNGEGALPGLLMKTRFRRAFGDETPVDR